MPRWDRRDSNHIRQVLSGGAGETRTILGSRCLTRLDVPLATTLFPSWLSTENQGNTCLIWLDVPGHSFVPKLSTERIGNTLPTWKHLPNMAHVPLATALYLSWLSTKLTWTHLPVMDHVPLATVLFLSWLSTKPRCPSCVRLDGSQQPSTPPTSARGR